jgi:hypothetical protein
MGMLLSLIPQEFWILVLVGTCIAVILGLVPKGAIASVIVTMLVLSIAGPFISSLLSFLPWWVSAILMVWFVLTVFNWIMTLLLGQRTRSHLSALLLHDLILAPFRFVGFLVRRR